MAEQKFPKEYFTLVQDGENLLDKPLKTRQLTYFQDAMLRFGKNKYNVIASIILLIIILMSVFVPMIGDEERYSLTHGSYVTLPPRVPLLEKIGIFDGTSDKSKQPIDPETLKLRETGELVDVYDIDFTTFDPDLYIGYPTERVNKNIREDYIFMDTLKLDFVKGTLSSELYIGGSNTLYVTGGRDAYSVMTNGFVTLQADPTMTLEINELVTGKVKVYFADESLFTADEKTDQTTGLKYTLYEMNEDLESFDDFVLLSTITTEGVATIDLTSIPALSTGKFIIRYELDEQSEDTQHVDMQEIVFTNADYEYRLGVEEPVTYENGFIISGYEFSLFQLVSFDSLVEYGTFSRQDAYMIRSSYHYDDYGAVFAPQERLYALSEYQAVLDANPGMEDAIIPETVTDNGWEFEDGWPIKAVTNIDEFTVPGLSIKFYNYTVAIDGLTALEVDSIPYFIFGTEAFGKDLFSLIFLGLRTSLLLGFLAAITNIFIGVIWGAISGYFGGQVDILMERFTDIWGSFPSITMIAIINVLMEPGFTALYVFLIYNGWIGASRTTRMQFYRYKGREYVLAARTLGASDMRIIFKHILPNALGTIITSVILSIPAVIFLEVNLSFLGFGIGNGATLSVFGLDLTGTSIGVILNDSKDQIFAGNYWILVWPTIIVSLLMITFNMFGNALRDAFNPQLRGSE